MTKKEFTIYQVLHAIRVALVGFAAGLLLGSKLENPQLVSLLFWIIILTEVIMSSIISSLYLKKYQEFIKSLK